MLDRLPLFQSLSHAHLQFLMEHSSIQQYDPGTIIFREGEPSECFMVVIEGQLEIVKAMGSNVERVINIFDANDFLGEMSLLHEERHRTASARSRTHVKLLEIPLVNFEMVVRDNAGLAYALMEVIVQRMHATENAAIVDLEIKNQQLTQSLIDLQNAQAQLISKGKMEHELSVARSIQESMLPSEIPTLPGWDLAAHWQPARAVSGDFYDFVPLSDGRLALIIGDVTDKGVPAALLMTVTRSMLRTAASQVHTPSELLARVNDLLCPDMPQSMFVTCFAAFLNPQNGRLVFANAGHCQPMWCHRDGGSTDYQVSELDARGMPLGLIEGNIYPSNEIMIQPGDHLLFYSDGLIEAHNDGGMMYGKQTAITLFHELAVQTDQTGCGIIESLIARLTQFTGAPAEQEDDITMVSLNYQADPPIAPAEI